MPARVPAWLPGAGNANREDACLMPPNFWRTSQPRVVKPHWQEADLLLVSSLEILKCQCDVVPCASVPAAALGEPRAALSTSWDGDLLMSHQTAALFLGKEETALPAQPAFGGRAEKAFLPGNSSHH